MGITYKITHRGSDDRNRANCCIVSVDCCCAQTWMNVLPIRASPADVVSTSCSITPVSALTDALESTANTVCLFTTTTTTTTISSSSSSSSPESNKKLSYRLQKKNARRLKHALPHSEVKGSLPYPFIGRGRQYGRNYNMCSSILR